MKHGKCEKFQMVGNQIHHGKLTKEYIIWKMYKKYSSDITQHGIKLIKCPVQEMKEWPEITVNDDLISELDDSGYR